MNKQEKLTEQYEDSLFAMLMDTVATARGQEALKENERLLQDPDAALPESTRLRCEKTIKRAFAKKRARAVRHTLWLAAKNIAVAAMAVVLMCSVTFAAFPSFRAATLNLLIEVFDEGARFQFKDPTNAEDGTALSLAVNWLPDGYELDSDGSNDKRIWRQYSNSNGNNIMIQKLVGEQSEYYIDTKNAEVSEIKIGSTDSTLVIKEGVSTLVIPDHADNAYVVIVADNIEQEVLVNIANRIEF